MSRSRRARLTAWVMILTGVSLAAASIVFTPASGLLTSDPNRVLSNAFLALPALSFFAVGGVLVFRVPGNRIGWLLLTIGLLWLAVGAADVVTAWAGGHERLVLARWADALGSLWVLALGVMATHLPLRLPDGVLPSPGWRWFSRLCTLVILAVTLGLAGDSFAWTLPSGLSFVLVLVAVLFILAITSLVLRYRRSAGIQRSQLRVIALGALLFVGTYLCVLPFLLVLPEDSATARALAGIVAIAYCALPVAIGLAVFRYRLYDIGVVINRAVVYGTLTAALAAAYLTGVLVLQFVLRPLTERSDLAVAGSTLASAALFRPARTWIQGVVNRRFYRRRYDAARTLEAFSGRLREQLDILALEGDLYGVVLDTVQPTHVSLWLRGELS